MPGRRLAFGDENRLLKALGEGFDNLRDVRDLFVGGEEEGSERFPRVLPQKPKSAAVREGVLQRRVWRELPNDFAKIDVYLEIVFQKFPVWLRMVCGED